MDTISIGLVFFSWYTPAAVICLLYVAARGYVARRWRTFSEAPSLTEVGNCYFLGVACGSLASGIIALIFHYFDRRLSYLTQFGQCAIVILPAIWLGVRKAAEVEESTRSETLMSVFRRAQAANRMALGTLRHSCSTDTLKEIERLEDKVAELMKSDSHIASIVLPHLVAEGESLRRSAPDEEAIYIGSRLDCIFANARFKPVEESCGPYE